MHLLLPQKGCWTLSFNIELCYWLILWPELILGEVIVGKQLVMVRVQVVLQEVHRNYHAFQTISRQQVALILEGEILERCLLYIPKT